ncbi:MAG: hypothetical protein ACFFAU_19895 [Candidatus Hodarchaeota archaeon]
MAELEVVITVALIFWIGYERFVELILDPIILKQILKPKPEEESQLKAFIVYGIAFLLGIIFFISGLHLLEGIFNDLGLTYHFIALILDFIITVFIFAAGPDAFHQVLSLIQQVKKKQKRS